MLRKGTAVVIDASGIIGALYSDCLAAEQYDLVLAIEKPPIEN